MGNTGRTRWKKGQSGNPRGRPRKGNTIADCLRAELEKVDAETKRTYKEIFARVLIRKAIVDSDAAAMRLIMEYTDGKPVQMMEHVGSIEIDVRMKKDKK